MLSPPSYHARGRRRVTGAAAQKILGHANISTTMRYARLTQDVVGCEARRMYEQGA